MPRERSEKTKARALVITGAAIAIITAAAAGWFFQAGDGLPVDDAYIHLVYARNLANGYGFSFNEGEPSFGTTSPLWVFLLAAFISRAEPVRLVNTLSLILFIGSTLLVFMMAWKDLSERDEALPGIANIIFAIAAAGLFCLSGNLLWIYFCGMESPLFLFMGLLAIFIMCREKSHPVFAGAVMGLLILTRITGGVLVLILFIYRLVKYRRFQEVYPFIVSIILYLPFAVYFWLNFHQVFPTTMGGKLASNLFNTGFSIKGAWRFISQHIHYIYLYNFQLFVILVIAIMLGVAFLFFRRKRELMSASSCACLISIWALLQLLLHALTFRSSSFLTPYHNLRYQVMIFPAIVFLATYIFSLFKTKWIRLISAAVLFAGILVSSFFAVHWWVTWHSAHKRHIKEVHQSAARWTRENLPENARIACFDIGSLKFYSERYVIDLGGLIDPYIHPYLEEKRVGPYLVKNHATHYFEMGWPTSDRLTGVKKDDGNLYRLRKMKTFFFHFRGIPPPSFLHSRGIVIYEIEYLEDFPPPRGL